MNNLLISSNWLVLIPSVTTFLVVIAYKRAVPALVAGILASLIILNTQFGKPLVVTAKDHILSAFVSDNDMIWENIFILLFLWSLGAFIFILNSTGSIEAISNLLGKHLKTRMQAKLATFCLGIFFFIDDYFNSLAIGTASRNLFDKRGLSREKLAYYLDSTAAPVCILVPISSWGAVIINILDNTIDNLKIDNFNNGLELFLSSVFYNFYSIITLIILFIVSVYNIDFPKMAKSEREARAALHVKNNEMIASQSNGPCSAYSAFWGIFALFFSSIIFMIFTGYMSSDTSEFSFIAVACNIKLGLSLLLGACIAILTLICFTPIKLSLFFKSYSEGLKTMAPAIQILILAWIFSFSMSELKVGGYISSLMRSDFISISNIPVFSFFIAGFMSLLTGTSWVTFSILIPIVCEVCMVHDISLIAISVGAVLGGAVFGDHCSPISDTSILSSTGAGCEHMKHISTQLPYCLLAASIAFLSYFILMIFYAN